MRLNQGFTMLEMLVVLALIGIVASLSAIGIRSARPEASDTRRALEAARREAAVSGRPVVLETDSLRVRLLPDGRVVSDSAVLLLLPDAL